MDANGNIHVNHISYKRLVYRMEYKTEFNQLNYSMLIEISKYLGGKVLKEKNNVSLIFDSESTVKDEFIYMLNLMSDYKPKTSRLATKFSYLKKGFTFFNFISTMHLSNTKTKIQEFLKKRVDLPKVEGAYYSKNSRTEQFFNAWLAGYLSDKAEFKIIQFLDKNSFRKKYSFSLKCPDQSLLEEIQHKFGFTNKAKLLKNSETKKIKMYIFETHNKKVLTNICNFLHYENLRGIKQTEFQKFTSTFQA